MMQTLLLAFRNLQRNLRRTVLTCLLLGCSLAALIVVDGIMQGTIKTLVDGATTLLSGHAQVHRRGFLDSYSTDLYISDPAPSITRIESGDAQAAWAQRTISTAMLSSPSGSTPGLVYGVDFTSEAGVSSIGRAVVQGVNLSGQQSELLMGQELAEHLEARLGDRVVVTLSKVDGGGVTQELFRLSGLLHFGVRELDANTAFINLDQAQQIIGIGNGVHEIAIRYGPNQEAQDPQVFLDHLSNDTLEALGWREFAPEIGAVLGVVDMTILIIGSVLLLLAAFGVINCMFMSVYDRIYEFGVVRAMGTSRRALMTLVLTEAFVLAAYSVLLGVLIGGGISWYFSVAGVALLVGEYEIAGMNLYENLHSILEPRQFTLFPLFIILVTLAAAVYPARFAARIPPSQALSKTF